MFTKLDMIYNQLVLTNYFEFRHGDVITDVIADQFRVCEYNNLIGSHPMFTKLKVNQY